MGRFAELTARFTAEGMSKMAAEAKARDIIYGDGEEPSDPAPAQISEPESFTSVEELWAQLQSTWANREKEGVELVDVLEQINDLLDRGVITSEQFEELLVRSQQAGLQSGRGRGRGRGGSGGRGGGRSNGAASSQAGARASSVVRSHRTSSSTPHI